MTDTSSAQYFLRLGGLCVAAFCAAPALGQTQSAVEALAGPDATPSLLRDQQVAGATAPALRWQDIKTDIENRSGLDFGLDYNVLGFAASESLGDDASVSGAFRLFGKWTLLNRDSANSGGLVFKFEHRHALTDVAATDFGGELGYIGLVNSVFSDQGARTTHLYWEQTIAEGAGVASVGWMDVTDYVDVFAIASPWSGFSNLAFQTGSGTIGALPDGAFGAVLGGFLTENFYAVAGIVDANADPTDILDGPDTLFSEGETFKTLELGWTSGAKALFIDNAHVTLWQVDDHADGTAASGHGLAFSYTRAIDNTWLPFLRGGWADGGGSLYEASLSAGFGYTQAPGKRLTGVGLNWSRPNSDTFGDGLDDQFTAEVFSRWAPLDGLEITPSLQLINNPAANPDDDFTALLGLRLRVAF